MKYRKEILLENGKQLLLRNGEPSDGETLLSIFIKTHEETDFLLSYPDEIGFTVEDEEKYLRDKSDSDREIEIMAVVDGRIAGSAGISTVKDVCKMRHRAEFGISVLKEYWRMGIGHALTEACIECARLAGYAQIELDVLADNAPAVSLYKSFGFTEYGSNPKGFLSRTKGYQEILYMRKEL